MRAITSREASGGPGPAVGGALLAPLLPVAAMAQVASATASAARIRPDLATILYRHFAGAAGTPRRATPSPRAKFSDMNLRPLGSTGVQVSPLCLGAMMFGAWGEPDHDKSIAIIHA